MKNMLLLVVLSLLSLSSCYEYHIHSYPLDMNRITQMSPGELDAYAGSLAVQELVRSKRSGSGGFISQISSSLTSGLSKASAGASSYLGSSSSKNIASASGSSSGSSTYGLSSGHGGYDYPKPAPSTKGPELLTLKKSILNTIFQAIKAITGGVTILKGQLIKGGGALTSGVGKLISVKGEAVANLGRNLVNSASLSPPSPAKHYPSPHETYVVPSGPPLSYGPPSSPSTSHGSINHPISSYGPPSSHSAPSSAYLPSHSSSLLPPSSSAPISFSSGQSSIYPAHPNSLYIKPPKHTSQYEAFINHDSSKYSPSGLQAGIIVMKNVDNTHYQHNNYIDAEPNHHTKGHTMVQTAVDALYGILKQPGGTAPAESFSIPSSHSTFEDDNIYAAPPPSASQVSFQDYNVPFKPLNIPSYKNSIPSTHSSFSAKSDDHGHFLTAKLTHMIDELLGVKKAPKHPMGYVSEYLYDAKPSHSTPNFVVKKPGLDPVKLSKVNDNLDKLQAKLERRDSGRSLTDTNDTFGSYESLTRILKAIQEGKQKEANGGKSVKELPAQKNETKSDVVVEKLDTTSNPQSNDYEKKATDVYNTAESSLVQKSLVYELRGDRLVQLTDEKTENA